MVQNASRSADCKVGGRIAVLASGRGSNLQALLSAIGENRLQANVVGVFSDRRAAAALEKVPVALRWAADARQFADRASFDSALGDAVAACRPDWVVCAGYMRILGDDFIARFHGRLLNIHPSMLPKYRGLHTHARAIEAGDCEHGGSVHFVVPELDAGGVVAQAAIPILAGDRPESLAQRLLPAEHALLVSVLALATAGRLSERDGMACLDGQPLFTPLRLDSAGMLTLPDTAPTP